MAQYIIVSDIHGRADRLAQVILRHPTAKGLIFLGDGAKDILSVLYQNPALPLYAVCGNCDDLRGSEAQTAFVAERLLVLEGHRIFMTHGHLYGVKHSLDDLLITGEAHRADMILYGHTHQPHDAYDSAQIGGRLMAVFNPGSLGDTGAYYGMLTIHGESIMASAVQL